MLDIGWTELVVIAIVLIIVVGPKDLPPMLRAFGKMATKLRGMAGDFRQQFDEALKEADLDEVRNTISDAQKLNPVNSIREAMNPLRTMGNELKADLQKSVSTTPKPQVAAGDSPEMAAALGTAEVKPADTVAAAAIASAKKQLDSAKTQADLVAEAINKPKAKRVTKPKVAETVVVASVAEVKAPVAKPAAKKASPAKTVVPDAAVDRLEQPKPKKTAANSSNGKASKKGDA
ncbi:Sec-independent protein translocase protein TatB [Pararhizobium sp.]|uniref:Sec-independent protein translocase protein TatB n=1 Tax=Pararhizobium sp. TaxID=1977563 RepID=UPI002719D01A|nr:Sec-independent protein translocase protein TatB [Pararhizobium sp.]MDO9415348.1 Sec-independent protein translocase protein TatB [Pararhizobium sp.]